MIWEPRHVSAAHKAEYRSRRLWTDNSLGEVVVNRLSIPQNPRFTIISQTNPFDGRYHDVLGLARLLASGLRSKGVGVDDVVAFQLPNWVEGCATFYACAILGCTVAPIPFFYGAREVGYILRQLRPRAFVATKHFSLIDYVSMFDQLRPELDDVEVRAIVGDPYPGFVPFDDLIDEEPSAPPERMDPAQPAIVAYTAGTTQEPKGVVHSQRSILAEAAHLNAAEPVGPPRINGAPIGHAIGMLGALLVPLMSGVSIHLIDMWNPVTVLETMVEQGLTAGSGSPFFASSLLESSAFTDQHLALMPYVALGGGPVTVEFADDLENRGISLVRFYGSTEHPSVTGGTVFDERPIRSLTDGRPLPGVHLRLVDEKGGDVEPGEQGQILTRGPDCCEGYVDATLTSARFDRDGWFTTGDLGVLDENRCLTIVGRLADLVIRGGESVSGPEVEAVLRNYPGVSEVAVVPAPDRRFGERVCVFMSLEVGAARPSLRDLRSFARRAGLAGPKLPEELHVIDDFPRTPTGKVQKYRLLAEVPNRP